MLIEKLHASPEAARVIRVIIMPNGEPPDVLASQLAYDRFRRDTALAPG
ncbi:hypothetical protein [Mycetocola sp. JXN-3]|nr:hypothetical protein [Mycetocola sp. JXN-3]